MVQPVDRGAQARAHRRELWLLIVILVLAAVLRVGWPALTEFKYSEARLEALALELTREGRLPLLGVPSSAGFDHSPISVYLYVPAFLFSSNPIPATIYGGLIGVAAVALCWWLGRRWPGGGPSAALISALLFATSPWAVAFSRKIWQVAFVPLLALAFVGLVVSALVGKRHWNLAWALAVYALLVQVHPSAISMGLALGLWLVVFWREVRLRPLLVGVGLGALTAVPFLVHQIRNGWPALEALRALPAATWDSSAVRLAWEAITGRGIHALAGEAYPLLRIVPQLGWIFNLVGWLTVGAALWLAWRAVTGWRKADTERGLGARVDLILLSWLILPVLANLRHSVDLHLHFFALVMPAAYLVIGRAVEGLFEVLRSVAPGRALKTASLLGFGILGMAQVVALVLMAHFVATHSTPGGFGTPLGHYLKVANQAVSRATAENAAEVLVVGEGDSVVVDPIPTIFDVLLRDQVAYRFVDGQSAAVFPPHRTVVLLTPDAGEAAEWYQPSSAARIPDSQDEYRLEVLDGSWPREDLEPIGGVRLFQNGIELQGYDWRGDIGPGGQAELWLGWQVLWLASDDTHFFAHVLDREGQQWGQHDAVGYPTLYRRKGDRVVSKFDISISPEASAEPYRGRVGLYVYPQVVGVPVVDQDGKPVSDVVVFDLRSEEP